MWRCSCCIFTSMYIYLTNSTILTRIVRCTCRCVTNFLLPRAFCLNCCSLSFVSHPSLRQIVISGIIPLSRSLSWHSTQIFSSQHSRSSHVSVCIHKQHTQGKLRDDAPCVLPNNRSSSDWYRSQWCQILLLSVNVRMGWAILNRELHQVLRTLGHALC